ncbi:MAG TPA: phosphoribosylglycinamide formyltransferase [Brevundimonas sp.]|jgi:formyltetrahydrofolate-dependent phosphoribosylglycinamide formyltransferase|uniref:phosphoribosylglycinamide formyltransferase n=1 Tax=Brevundimonas sp. TaxID=1871086 RepID=UPI002DF5399B|nr:phosphoribosylglycinamide formyltransferase [Brevundimonas sp.]
MSTPDSPRVPVAVLISGAGSNMAAIADAARMPDAAFEVRAVISNVPGAGGLALAEARGIPAVVVDHRAFGQDRRNHEQAIHAVLEAHGVEVVALAGYMRLLTPWLVSAWEGRMLNIHPSLLPRHPGLDTHGRALKAGDVEAGCTVHVVIDDVDAGPILGQSRVPVLPGDDVHALAARVRTAEHELYPAVLDRFCRDLRRA